MADFKFDNVPAVEAIEHLRQKALVPTDKWSQFMGAANAHGFTVAGATKIDLLKDLHTDINAALESGEGISAFRKRFEQTVAKHGWEYKGKRGWRTRVIYDTNLRTAHMAGRWAQIQRTKKSRPNMVYMTVGDERVRDAHSVWHKLALSVDDKWWMTHFPPNGWGCRCYVITANDRQLKRLGTQVGDAPAVKTTKRVNTYTGELIDVPEGIDTGWDYNVGQAWLGPDIALGQKIAQLPSELQQTAVVAAAKTNNSRLDAWQKWLKDREADKRPRGYMFTVGHFSGEILEAIKKHKTVLSTAIVVADRDINHLKGKRKDGAERKDDNKKFPTGWLEQLPILISQDVRAIFEQDGDIVMVVGDSVGQDKNRSARVVLQINYREKKKVFNSVRSLGVIQTHHLKTKAYRLLWGNL